MDRYYDIMQVCLHGHKITDCWKSSPDHRKKRCDKCNQKTCLKYDHFIRGYYHIDCCITDCRPQPPAYIAAEAGYPDLFYITDLEQESIDEFVEILKRAKKKGSLPKNPQL